MINLKDREKQIPQEFKQLAKKELNNEGSDERKNS